MATHIAFVTRPIADEILRGSKTCESRLSIVRHLARNVAPGDTLIFKSGDGFAIATVERVETYESLRPLDVDALRDLYTDAVGGTLNLDEYWKSKRVSKHAVFIWFADVHPVRIPAHLLPSNQAGWVSNYKPSPEVLNRLSATPYTQRLLAI